MDLDLFGAVVLTMLIVGVVIAIIGFSISANSERFGPFVIYVGLVMALFALIASLALAVFAAWKDVFS